MNASQRLRERFQKTFATAYDKLNTEQRSAVDVIDGPVMVIAGPGTGKTQILAVRIGRILRETDAQAHNILCLTYTEAASVAMRKRLVDIIGPDGHRVNIHTFHGFCNQVIQEHLGYFGNYRQLEQITDLEEVELFQEILIDLDDDHILKKLKSLTSHDTRRLKNLFVLMKKEHYSANDLHQAADQYLVDLLDDQDMYYKRNGKGYTKGDLKQKAYDEKVRRMQELKAGASLFDGYQERMMSSGRYDYDDMILWVIRALSESPDLLSEYQERYHYFLVDEFQDTNGAQKQILDLLVSFWEEEPNIFVVGDDDQAIYKFQGANLDNITDFKKQYKPKPVVLKQNYRSSQLILDAAMGLIDFNKERIVKMPDFNLDKDLVAKGDNRNIDRPVTLRSYTNNVQEQAHIALQIVQMYERGEDLGKVAILYRNHKQIEKLVEVLEKKGVPLNIRKKVDVLNLPLIQNITLILRYLNDIYMVRGYTDRALIEMMHFTFFDIIPSDIYKLVWYNRNRTNIHDSEASQEATSLDALISDLDKHPTIDLKNRESIKVFASKLEKWLGSINDLTLQGLFQQIINEGDILSYILRHTDKTWLLQVLGTYFDLIKNESAKKPDLTLQELLDMLDSMTENGIPLAVNKVVQNANGVHFTTAHSAKGLEYEQVIIIGSTKDIWDRKRGGMGKFTYPPAIKGDIATNEEDERRLMYVAMTRAEQTLDISYSLQKEDGKDLGPSQFVDEIRLASELVVTPQIVGEDAVNDFQFHILKQTDKIASLIDHELIQKRLEGYKLSVTHLNKYLKCPITFYFETILQVPMSRTKYMGYGNAAHYALEMYYKELNEGNSPAYQDLYTGFIKGMNRHKSHFTQDEFKDMSAHGGKVLSAYFDHYLTGITGGVVYDLEAKITDVEYQGIPIKGVLDRVTIRKDYIEVTDYKTGNPLSTRNKPKLYTPNARRTEGGDYWRQIVFYKILCDSDRRRGWNMTRGTMDFIEPDSKTGAFTRQDFVVLPDHIEVVGGQIKKAWEGIQNHKFEEGCGDDSCYWCNFVTNDYVGPGAPIDEDIQMEEAS